MSPKTARTLGTYGFLALLVAYFSITTPNFASYNNVINILVQIAPVVIAGAAVTLVMVSGSLDLSVGGVLALSGVLSATFAAKGWPLLMAFGAGVLIGVVVGLVNGFLVVFLRINPVIATLGTLYAATGTAWLLTGDATSVSPGRGDYSDLGTSRLLNVPWTVIVMIVVLLIFIFLERWSVLGKYSVAVGSNFEGARLAGIRVNGFRVLLFALAGAACAIAGVMYSSQLASGQPSVGVGFEFSIIVAAVVGGVSLSGGRGTVLGTLAGAGIIGVIDVALNQNFVNPFWQQIIEGILLVTVVAVDSLLQGGLPRPKWLGSLRAAKA